MFEDLVLEYGTDPGMRNLDNLTNGYAVHADSIVWDSDFQKAAMELSNIGDISEPVVSGFGVHILKYQRDIPGGAVEMTDTIESEILAHLKEEAVNNRMTEQIMQIAADAEIVWTEAGEPWKLPEEEAAAE